MNKFLGFILRILLLVLVLALFGVGGWALHTYMQWAWWDVGALGLGLLAFIILCLVGRHLYYRHREERFIRKMVEHDRPRLAAEDEDLRLAELKDRWRRGVDTLRHSSLARGGNAIYSLPWFMVLGESGSGKSTAISHARLASGGTSADSMPKITSTRNCDWWFFEKAVVLDTAGRYAVPVNEASDTREWEEFVRLLAAHRRKEPLNGLILTLSTEQLERGETAVSDYGRCLRQRINTLSRAMGASFPVYVLVTKMDRVMGLTDLASLMSPEECRQALGLLHRENSARKGAGDNMSFLEQALAHVHQRLHDLTMLFAVESRSASSHAALLPEEMTRLYPGIRAFARAVFSPSAYGDTPTLRGIFFGSGRQEGSVHSRLLTGLETFRDCSWNLPGTSNAIFLSDFFSSILPRERWLGFISDRWLTRLSFRRHVPYMAWLCFLMILCGYFSVSFITRMTELKGAQQHIPSAVALDGNLNSRVRSLSLAADTISGFEKTVEHHRWLVPGKSQSEEMLGRLRQHYTEWMRPDLVNVNTELVARTLHQLPPDQAQQVLITLCDYQSWVYRALVSARDKAAFPTVTDSMDSLNTGRGLEHILPASSTDLNNSFTAYVRWEDPLVRDTLISHQSASIEGYMNMLGRDLGWLTTWLNTRPGISSVRLTDFWPAGAPSPSVPPAYTAEGFRRMEGMLSALGNASQDKPRFAQLEKEYRSRYADALRTAWWTFAGGFAQALQDNVHPESWHRLGVSMASPDNPYFNLVRRMSDVFALVADQGTPTPMDSMPALFVELMGRHEQVQQPGTLQTAISEKKDELTAKISRERAEHIAVRDEAAKMFGDYLNNLVQLGKATDTDSEALLMIATGYRGGQDAAQTAVGQALQTANQLQGLTDANMLANRQFWDLVKGPIAWYTVMAVSRSACELNALWNATVLDVVNSPAYGAQWETILDEQSPVNKFVQGVCQPFIRPTRDGWMPTSWLGMRYPLSGELLSFLDQGIDASHRAKEKYVVGITAQPVNVNDMAQKPHRARLRLECGDNTQTLDNYNYEVSANFTWEPAVCGRVSLELSFGTQTVTTTWEDEWAFQTFLRDFSGGEVLLTPEDFPGQEDLLREMDVTEIRVRYALRGADEALMAQKEAGLPLPSEAAYCSARRATTMGISAPLTGMRLPDMPSLELPKPRPQAASAGKADRAKGGRLQ
ncbi:MAG: type VI secretion protein IcmF/TssM N-terminal domain-containing protein [Desulfovibrionaceae bacterium]|nr:type VI secretion protein IcmF/TssM N-terminal domain-containing protein [Desulfovibrionaceae bacterium]